MDPGILFRLSMQGPRCGNLSSLYRQAFVNIQNEQFILSLVQFKKKTKKLNSRQLLLAILYARGSNDINFNL